MLNLVSLLLLCFVLSLVMNAYGLPQWLQIVCALALGLLFSQLDKPKK